jgi:hypothetical protein
MFAFAIPSGWWCWNLDRPYCFRSLMLCGSSIIISLHCIIPTNTRQHLLLAQRNSPLLRPLYVGPFSFLLHFSFLLLHGSFFQPHLLTIYSYYQQNKNIYPFIWYPVIHCT